MTVVLTIPADGHLGNIPSRDLATPQRLSPYVSSKAVSYYFRKKKKNLISKTVHEARDELDILVVLLSQSGKVAPPSHTKGTTVDQVTH